MSESDSIKISDGGPVTEEQLVSNLQTLGVERNDTLLVHSSLSHLGWVVGGSVTVVNALLNAVGPNGTVVMPTHSGDLSDPANWSNPAVDKSWWSAIKDTMPPFDPARTPTRGMGAIVDCFRSVPDVLRSHHPQTSFAAFGRHASQITNNHLLENSLGESSPLARLYELDAKVLLLGVSHESNTSLHLAEYRVTYNGKNFVKNGAPGAKAGAWIEFEDIELNSEDFETLGTDFEKTGSIRSGKVGYASSRLMRQRRLVDFAEDWFASNRSI